MFRLVALVVALLWARVSWDDKYLERTEKPTANGAFTTSRPVTR